MTHPDARLQSILDTLLSSGAVTPASIERAERASSTSGTRIDAALLHLGLVSDQALAEAASAATGIPLAVSPASSLDLITRSGLPESFLAHGRCLPIGEDGDTLVLGVEDPFDDFTEKAARARTGRPVERRLLLHGTFDRLWTELHADTAAAGFTAVAADATAADDDLERLKDLASDAPVIRLVNTLIDDAVEQRASDIHITALPGRATRLRLRVDGHLRDAPPPPAGLHAAILSRIKIMAGLDIAERRLPQDGRIRVGIRGRSVDIRVATMPHVHSEGAVLRILDRRAVNLDLDDLGFSPAITTDLLSALSAPNGLVLVTGPTGSGKTTTLYAALRRIATADRNIITVEDPVEFELEGISQIQVSRKIGLDFAHSLRAVLRQDPDVIMVGEIRDRETAAVAIQAALTGHLVLATVHTNTAAGAIPRLIDMGVEAFLVSSTLRGVLAQRLVRTLCPMCREATGLVAEPYRAAANGCPECDGVGYRGRQAIGEFLPIDEQAATFAAQGVSEREIEARLRYSRLCHDADAKIAAGLTSRSEVRKVLGV